MTVAVTNCITGKVDTINILNGVSTLHIVPAQDEKRGFGKFWWMKKDGHPSLLAGDNEYIHYENACDFKILEIK